MRVLFAGTPEIAVPSLQELKQTHTVVGVLTSPDRTAGRGRHVVSSPVKLAAHEMGLPVLQPDRLNAAARAEINDLAPELLVVFAYGKIFGPKFLSLFPKGGINLHPSLLPRHRGPSPIPAAILAGDSQTGITVQEISLEMDAGDILEQVVIPLDGSETAESLGVRVAERAPAVLRGAVDAIQAGTAAPVPQSPENVSYCSVISKSDGLIDWHADARTIERMVRAYHPWPTAHTDWNGQQLSILAATVAARSESAEPGKVVGLDKRAGILIQTGDGILTVQRLQLQSKKALDFKSFWNGVRDFEGAVLGTA
jgi:methionyl-tRNA formyltransferase